MVPCITGGQWSEFDSGGRGLLLLGPGDWLPWLCWPFAISLRVYEGDVAVITTSDDGVSAEARHLTFDRGAEVKEETDLTLESLGRWSLIEVQVLHLEAGRAYRFDEATLRDEYWFPGPQNGN